MTPEVWRQVDAILERALDLPADERAGYVESACAGDAALLAEVRTMLASCQESQELFEAPALHPQQRLGAYRIVRELGRGAMGVVYLAERDDEQFQKQVAIKVVASTITSSELVRRFRSERRILARLEHVNIARLLDAGATPEGLRYIVMEYVDGVPLDRYCRERGLDGAERLRLFQQICSGVQWAHRNLIVHRDIKPGNILVTADGTPKLLDFGIAKIADPADGPREVTLLQPMTPEYASPEQLSGRPATTASDIYSLGVLLRKLDAQGASADLEAIIAKAMRPEPEERYASADELSADIGRCLSGMPVLAKKGSFRYVAGKFVRRHRAPVAAAVLAALVGMAGVVAIVRESRIASMQRTRAERRFDEVRKLANSLLFEIHDAIRDLPGSSPVREQILQKALGYLDSLAADAGNEPALLGELATAYERVGDLEGHSFANLGNTAAGLNSYRKALHIREQLAAAAPPTSLDRLGLAASYRKVAYQSLSIGNVNTASDLIARAIVISEQIATRNPASSQLLYELSYDYEILGHIQGGNWSAVDRGDLPAALKSYQKSVAVLETLVRNEPAADGNRRALALFLGFAGDVQLKLGDDEGALRVEQRAEKIVEELLAKSQAPTHRRDQGTIYDRLANVYEARGDFARALDFRRKLVDIYVRLSAEDPQNILMKQDLGSTYVDLGRLLAKTGKAKEGVGWMDRGVAINEEVAKANPANAEQLGVFAAILVSRAEALSESGRNAAAIKDQEEARAIYRDLHRLSPANVHALLNEAACEADLGELYLRAGNLAKAEESLRHALEKVSEPHQASLASNPQVPYTLAQIYSGLGDIGARAGQREDARQWYARSVEMWKQIVRPARITPYGFISHDPGHALAASIAVR